MGNLKLNAQQVCESAVEAWNEFFEATSEPQSMKGGELDALYGSLDDVARSSGLSGGSELYFNESKVCKFEGEWQGGIYRASAKAIIPEADKAWAVEPGVCGEAAQTWNAYFRATAEPQSITGDPLGEAYAQLGQIAERAGIETQRLYVTSPECGLNGVWHDTVYVVSANPKKVN